MKTVLMASVSVALALMTTGPVAAQDKPGFKDTPMLPGGQWRVHDADRPAPIVVTPAATPGGAGDQIVPFNPKRVVLEVFGDPGATATISYLDVDARPQQVDGATLPWSYEDSTTKPAVVVNIVAQGNGSTLGCRIIVDGVVKAENTVNTPGAYTYCLDKSG